MSPFWTEKRLTAGLIGLLCFVVLTLAGTLFYIKVYPFLSAAREIRRMIEHPEDLPTAPTWTVLQKDILEITWADTNLIEATVALLEKTDVKGEPPMPSDVFSVVVVTDKTEGEGPVNLDEVAKRSALVTVLPIVRDVGRQLRGGWLQRLFGEDLFTNYVEVAAQNVGRGLEFFADAEMKTRLDSIQKSALRGDILPLVTFLEKTKKVGVILPNVAPIAKRFGVNVAAASIVGEVGIEGDSSGRVLLTCETERDARKIVELGERFRDRALDVLLGGHTPGSEGDHWEFTMRREAARYVRKIKVNAYGTTVRISGKLPDVIVRRLIACVPRMADRLARARGHLSGRGVDNVHQGLQGPPETIALIEGAKNVNWVKGERLSTNDNALVNP